MDSQEGSQLGEQEQLVARLRQRETPQWFTDAKLGIFVHWTPASVPAFAPRSSDPFAMAEEHGWEYAMANSPYAEWYQNSLHIPASPVANFHASKYGTRTYDSFIDDFTAAHHHWSPNDWARTFSDTGAKYVVLVTKHHDGYLLWPSTTSNPSHGSRWNAKRDLVGELGSAVRNEQMRWGVYYSGGLDWTFGGLPITDFPATLRAIPASVDYAEYCEAHWRELIDREQPDILWNDIAHPTRGNAHALFEHYYQRIPHGLVNDRFDMRGVRKGIAHADYITPEYSSGRSTPTHAWEVCRGIGQSFGYNHIEEDADYLSAADLQWMFVDIVSNGGNLLLNVGPQSDGTIPAVQRDRLHQLGRFNRAHGHALFGSRPVPNVDRKDATTPVRFTKTPDAIHAFLRVDSSNSSIEISWPENKPVGDLTCLGATIERRSSQGVVVRNMTEQIISVTAHHAKVV